MMSGEAPSGLIFDMDAFAVHDGPGIRLAVYLKGCPLRCAWCHSPESQAAATEILLARERCRLCGACGAACPRGLHQTGNGRHMFERSNCAVCGKCVEVCAAGALKLSGRWVGADEVVRHAVRLQPFFEYSGGGITLTGGEATFQAAFAEFALRESRLRGIHTAIETCGACDWPTLERLADECDLILYDLKLISAAEHRRWTGQGNESILDNARRLAGREVEVRVPLVPEVTDTDENVEAVFGFMLDAGLRRLTLLPYNASSAAKYEWLDRSFALPGETQTPERLAALKKRACDLGIRAEVAH